MENVIDLQEYRNKKNKIKGFSKDFILKISSEDMMNLLFLLKTVYAFDGKVTFNTKEVNIIKELFDRLTNYLKHQ